ncbi:MAG TPA: hypothetical protein VF484_01125 [Candidatus Limnocylindrales bacterium]
MDLLIGITLAVVVLIVFDTLAVRLGADTRPGFTDDRSRDLLRPRFM